MLCLFPSLPLAGEAKPGMACACAVSCPWLSSRGTVFWLAFSWTRPVHLPRASSAPGLPVVHNVLSCMQVCIQKQKGEILGIAIVESGWGSILPTVVIANLMHGGPAEKSGELSIGDRLMSVNGTSLVGLPLSTCQSIIRVRLGAG